MLSVTKLLCETYDTEKRLPRHLEFALDKRPVVVWNITKRCNLGCVHCYSNSHNDPYPDELSTDEALKAVDDLALLGVPAIIFSGGEPLLRKDIFELGDHAGRSGIRCALSTNGVLIDKATARRIRDAGFAYVGVSIDGVGEVNDRLRGMRGAFEAAVTGLRNLRDEGITTGLRLTLSKRTVSGLPSVLDLSEREDIPRVYISHLVYSGRGIMEDALSHEGTRNAVDLIFDKAEVFHRRGIRKDILTGNNDSDGAYLYLRLKSQDPRRAQAALRLLKIRGGNSTGVMIGSIDNVGGVHPDQFWGYYSLGNVRVRPFSEIWTDAGEPLLRKLRERTEYLKGRCRICSFLDICRGNSRVRAEAYCGDTWAEDPACYLTDEEIGASRRQSKEAEA